MAEGTLNLLKDCQLAVFKPNPRQYIASIPSLPGLEVWFQRETDVVRKIRAGHVDLGIVGYDTMGIADAILDLIGSGTTLRENNLKQLAGSVLLKSQGVLVASKRALLHRKTALEKTHEILERLEAHLRARSQFTVTAHMRGKSMEEVADCILNLTDFHGLQGPTISPVFTRANGAVEVDFYAVVICVTKNLLSDAVKQLRQVGGSGVLVSPLTYIFDEEPPCWQQLLDKLKSAE